MSTSLESTHSKAAAPDWAAVRREFPILEQRVGNHPLVYFDNAATSQKPRAVIDAISRYYERDNANVHRGLHELSARATAAYETAREKIAKFLNAAEAAEVVFTRGTTEAINLVAQAWAVPRLREGDVILLTELEHHSNLVPWQFVAERTGARLRFVPVRQDGTLEIDRVRHLLTAEVKLFAFTHVSNSLGTVTPVAEWCRLARELGIITLVDGAQSAGHLPVDVRALGCDFYALSGHKMCGPTGSGALYGRRELLEIMPPWHGGGEMIVTVAWEKSTFKEPPHRFEAGTPPISEAIGLGAAVDFIESIGRDHIAAHDARLTAHARCRLAEVPGLRIVGPPESGALVSFVIESVHPHDLVTYANEYALALRGGHHCTMPLMKKLGLPGTARASFYFYNTEAEIDRMIDVLNNACKFFV
ncbi:MAG: aminotransferase class V-fold PLP-dependent enzyme [Verrucomicrobiales bacterium]